MRASPERTRPEASERAANLLVDLGGLVGLLAVELEAGSELDAFLFAAGINQILEDHLHGDPLQLRRAASQLRKLPSPAGQASTAALRASVGLARALRRVDPRELRVLRLQRRVGALVELLAAAAVGRPDVAADSDRREERRAGGESMVDMRRLAAETLSGLGQLPRGLLRQVVRQPTSFRSLDQQPADLEAIVEKFTLEHPDRSVRLLLVGVRTSGSYLAPLYRVYLEAAGYRDVRVMTIRPEHDFLPWEVREVQALAADRGLLLVADDPPKTGAALGACLQRFERLSIARDSMVLFLPLLDETGSPPPLLATYSAITLPRNDWAIEERLSAANLAAVLDELLTGRTIQLSSPDGEERQVTVQGVRSAKPRKLPPVTGFQVGSASRRHSRALVRARLLEVGSGRELEHDVYVKGVGLGYFGDHSRVIAETLAEFLPELYGFRHGLLFRRWLPDGNRIEEPRSAQELDRLGERIADYVHARTQRLAVAEDLALRSGGAQDQVVKLLAGSFGRLALPSRLLLRSVTRRLLRVERASVVDGSMSPSQWFQVPAAGSASGALLKVDYDERAFSNQDTVVDELYSFDPAFDLAGAAAAYAIRTNEPGLESRFEASLRLTYMARARVAVPAERWLLYQLLHTSSQIEFLQEALEVKEGSPDALPASVALEVEDVARSADAARRAMARFEQRYLASLFLADAPGKSDGPLCAIDIDGVLEVVAIGYSSCTPLGALCLRALVCHGYRPILATGRSLDEVRDRCVAYGLRGGVAEYGAVVYDAVHDRATELLTEEQRGALDRLRSRLAQVHGVYVEAAHQRSVRASGGEAAGVRRPLPADLTRDVLGELGLVGQVRVVHGDAQTDFVLHGVNKGRGIQALVEAWAGAPLADDRKPLALAVGDTELDLPMLGLARMAFAPANADQKVREAGIEVTSGDCQQGLARAVARLVGHHPGTCPVCSAPAPVPDAELLLTVLSAQSATRWGKLAPAAHLARLLVQRPPRSGGRRPNI